MKSSSLDVRTVFKAQKVCTGTQLMRPDVCLLADPLRDHRLAKLFKAGLQSVSETWGSDIVGGCFSVAAVRIFTA